MFIPFKKNPKKMNQKFSNCLKFFKIRKFITTNQEEGKTRKMLCDLRRRTKFLSMTRKKIEKNEGFVLKIFKWHYLSNQTSDLPFFKT